MLVASKKTIIHFLGEKILDKPKEL